MNATGKTGNWSNNGRLSLQGAALIYHRDLAAYDLGDGHPLNPLRLTLSLELMKAYGLLGDGVLMEPRMASEKELLLAHSSGYIEAVREASDWAAGLHAGTGLGTDDNPIYPGMHDVAALTCGSSIVALEEVLAGRRKRAFAIAGGMHHAHRSRAAGFSVYNDAAVAICCALQDNPELKVLYLDFDAHHGDGVQEAFLANPQVMTVSVHESGVHAFPGTGFPTETGYEGGEGFSVNVPLPPLATDECFLLAFERVIAPLATAFAPDVIVAQLGVDAHHADPQTELGLTLSGYRAIVNHTIDLAEKTCGGRLVALGGGGYHIVEVVPLAWTWLLARLLDVELCEEVPQTWREHVCTVVGHEPPRSLGAGDVFASPPERSARVLELTEQTITQVRGEVFSRHGLEP